MSVHPNRGGWEVRWREQGTNRARRFHTEAEAVAFDQGLRGARASQSSTPNVYPDETSVGVRWRYTYRASRGRQSSKRGFRSEREAARDRERTVGRVHQGGLYVSPLFAADAATPCEHHHPEDELWNAVEGAAVPVLEGHERRVAPGALASSADPSLPPPRRRSCG